MRKLLQNGLLDDWLQLILLVFILHLVHSNAVQLFYSFGLVFALQHAHELRVLRNLDVQDLNRIFVLAFDGWHHN